MNPVRLADGGLSDGGYNARRLRDPSRARELFSRLHLPGVYVDGQGHLICLHPNTKAAEHLLFAATHILATETGEFMDSNTESQLKRLANALRRAEAALTEAIRVRVVVTHAPVGLWINGRLVAGEGDVAPTDPALEVDVDPMKVLRAMAAGAQLAPTAPKDCPHVFAVRIVDEGDAPNDGVRAVTQFMEARPPPEPLDERTVILGGRRLRVVLRGPCYLDAPLDSGATADPKENT